MVYTKTGDQGTTSLVGGSRVMKCDPRVEAYGTVDELNSHIGLLAEMTKELDVCSQLKTIQNDLFVIQTLLATEDTATYAKLPQLNPEAVATLEGWIDNMDSRLPKLKSFVIPGGSMASAQAHVARTVCRRAERCIVTLQNTVEIEKIILQYINRLSDYLFVTARYILLLENKEEIFWSAG
ncbi:MAG: cob(I)yrinic acid a,c-diamide adenosyltransferase [Bacteroidales bacterium]|nr:cob(I)yrinic acid a,c-diamide adenosyltransferase [Bacteroidales bacterium]